MNRILSIDPGQTTGYAVATVFNRRDFELLELGQFTWDERFRLGELIKTVQTVVVEEFRLYRHAKENQVGSNFPSVHIIGIVDTYCHQYGDIPIVLQPASVRQNVSVLPQHRELVKSPHMEDAYRHLRYYALTRK